MLRLKNITISLTIIWELALSSCYLTEKTKGLAYIRPYKSDSLEIELPYTVKGRGSLHNFSFEKYSGNSADWIYISKIQKTILSDSINLVYTKGNGSQSNLKGEMSIKDSSLTINFKIPRYNNKDVVKRWTNYRFNGSYNLSFLK